MFNPDKKEPAMSLKTILAVLPMLLALACALHAADDTAINRGTLTKDDAEYVTKAASAGLFEVRSSELVVKRGTLTADEKKFAEMMITDHNAANAELEKLAAKKGFTVPSAPMAKHQKLIDEIGKADDKKVATTYLSDQVDAHDEAISLFKKAGEKADDPDLRAFFNDKLSVLRHHYDEAKRLYKAR
jgi:putative membrane protein